MFFSALLASTTLTYVLFSTHQEMLKNTSISQIVAEHHYTLFAINMSIVAVLEIYSLYESYTLDRSMLFGILSYLSLFFLSIYSQKTNTTIHEFFSCTYFTCMSLYILYKAENTVLVFSLIFYTLGYLYMYINSTHYRVYVEYLVIIAQIVFLEI